MKYFNRTNKFIYMTLAMLGILATGACGPVTSTGNSDHDGNNQEQSLRYQRRSRRSVELSSLESCEVISMAFKDPILHTLSTKDAALQFSLVKSLRSEGKGGAFPSLVKTSDDQKTKFLKIFLKKIEPGMSKNSIVKDKGYLEIFNSCRLGRLVHFSANLQPGISPSIFFANAFEFGFFKTDDPFVKAKKKKKEKNSNYYPYLVQEAVDGITLTKLATEPKEAIKSLGFNIETAPPMVLESILLQIIVALKNANLALELTHNDLHPGNILLSRAKNADFYIEYAGKKMQLQGPLVKIIDFEHSESEDFHQKTSVSLLWIQNRPFIEQLEVFTKALREPIGFLSRARIYSVSENQDIAMYNLILRALKPALRARGKVIENQTYCHSYDDCIELLSKWWK